jgi:iron complex outermembrane receptor protein
VTLTWRPADTLTLFGAYKEGFKSGSFNSDQLSPTGRDFGPEYARGGELGLKTLLSDETLRMNLALYYYRYRDLQVGTIEGAGATAMTRVLNAAEATAKGAEFDFEYAPAGLSGLTFNGSLAYNEGEFEEFPSAPCYGGQTQALGCNIDLTGDGIGDAQNLAGTPLNAAPDWAGSIGFDLDRPIGAGSLGIGLSSATTYEGSIYRDLTQAPGTRQSDFWKLNANLRLYDDSRGWEAALIGKNLTDEYTGSKCAVGAFGGPLGGLAPNPRGGVTHSDTDEVICILGRGREIWLRLTWNFGGT